MMETYAEACILVVCNVGTGISGGRFHDGSICDVLHGIELGVGRTDAAAWEPYR